MTLLAEWREEVRKLAAAHDLDVPTLNDHIPDLLEELAGELAAHVDGSMIGELKKTPSSTASTGSASASTSRRWWRSTTPCAAFCKT